MKYKVGQIVKIKGRENYYAFHNKLVKISDNTVEHNGHKLYGVRGYRYISAFSRCSYVYQHSEIIQC